MHILKQKRVQVVRLALLVVTILGTIATIKLFTARGAGDGNVIPLNHGGTKVMAWTTNYGSNDTNPPGFLINWPTSDGYATVHDRVGGKGTFADPITVAINSKTGPDGTNIPSGSFAIGTKFYVPRLHLYFVAEDSCNIAWSICINDGKFQEDSTHVHLDFYNGYSPDNTQAIIDCELSYGDGDGGYSEVIANPGDGYPLPDDYPDGTSLFDSNSNHCIGKDLWDRYNGWTIGDANSPAGSPTADTNSGIIDVDDSVQGSGPNQFDYQGSAWYHCSTCDWNDYGFYNGSNSWSRTRGDTVTITFIGVQIKFYGVTGPAHGIASVSLDDGSSSNIDFYAATTVGNTLLYTSPILDNGQHTLKIVVTGDMNPHATWPGVNPDRVEIVSTLHPTRLSPRLPSGSEGNSSPPTTDPNWNVLWSDDFNTGSLDTSKWTVSQEPAGWVNHEQECYQDDGKHVRVEDNNLILQADHQSSGDCPYVSGRLDTAGKYLVQPPTDGKPVRIEASIQLPQGGNGTWPAFWMLGQNIGTAGWPNCGEIDIMEQAGSRAMPLNTIQGTVHGLSDQTGSGRYTLTDGDFSGGYHTFGVDWYTDRLVFSVDGNDYQTVMTDPLGGASVFNQPFFIILNFAVGGDWPGNVDDGTPFPQQMKVDFVRVSQHV